MSILVKASLKIDQSFMLKAAIFSIFIFRCFTCEKTWPWSIMCMAFGRKLVAFRFYFYFYILLFLFLYLFIFVFCPNFYSFFSLLKTFWGLHIRMFMNFNTNAYKFQHEFIKFYILNTWRRNQSTCAHHVFLQITFWRKNQPAKLASEMPYGSI